MASPAASSTSWSSWLRSRLFGSGSSNGSPNFSTWAYDGDNDERMLDDINFMELRDGKRLSHFPCEREGSERNSEYDDNVSVADVSVADSTRMNPPDYYSHEDFVTASSSSLLQTPTTSGNLAATSDTGFFTPGGSRRFLTFAQCQQLPKTDYMYAYTPVYSPSIYPNRDLQMPNMCRNPIRSSSHMSAGTIESKEYNLRSRVKIGSIPIYGTDCDETADMTTGSFSSRFSDMLHHGWISRSQSAVLRFWAGSIFYASLAWDRFKAVVTSYFALFGFVLFFTFIRLPKNVLSVTCRKTGMLGMLLCRCLIFCITQPSMAIASTSQKLFTSSITMSSSAAVKSSSVATTIVRKCTTSIVHFWMTIRRVSSVSKEVCVLASQKTFHGIRRIFWPLLLFLLTLLMLAYFPYGAVYQKASDFYSQANATKFFEQILPVQKAGQKAIEKTPEKPPIYEEIRNPDPAPPTVSIVKVDCVDCWKQFSEQVHQLLADRDKEMFSKLDSQLASATASVWDNSDAKLSAATEKLSTLENAIAQLHQAIADARAEAKRTLDEAESLRKDIREEDKAALQRVVDEMWSRVDAKLTASTDAIERKLAEQQVETFEKIDAKEAKSADELRRAIDRAQQAAGVALDTANAASAAADAVATRVDNLPPPPPPVVVAPPAPAPPVIVECKKECNSGTGTGISTSEIENIVTDAIARYDADRTGQPDYALESSGGSVVSVRCSKTYDLTSGTVSIFGFPVYFDTKSPRTAIQAAPLVPGNCWAFSGSRGFLVVRLSYRIVVTSVSLEHIAKQVAPLGRVDSAPREFSIYVLANESDPVGRLIGNFTYDAVNGPALQNFVTEQNGSSTEQSTAVQYVELRILSNYGHPNYTCIYRFRVHGQPVDPTANMSP